MSNLSRQRHARQSQIEPKTKGAILSKQDFLEFKGKVTELLPNAMFRVKLENIIFNKLGGW